MSDEATQLVEDQVGVRLQLDCLLLFLSLDQAFDSFEALLEDV